MILAKQQWELVCHSEITDRLRTEFEALSANERTVWIAQKKEESERILEASSAVRLLIAKKKANRHRIGCFSTDTFARCGFLERNWNVLVN